MRKIRPTWWFPLSEDINSALGGRVGSHVRASTATYEHPVTELVTVANTDIPRFENVGGKNALLVEPVGTNLCLQREQFDSGTWGKAFSSTSANAATAPDGNVTADKLIEDGTAASTHYIQQGIAEATFTDNVSIAFTTYVKQGERTWVHLRARTKANTYGGCYFDLANGVVGTATGGATGTIVSASNGFYRCRISFNISTGATLPLFFIFIAEADSTITYDGDGSSGIYLWGAQIEEFPVPTSYMQDNDNPASTVSRATESGYSSYVLPAGIFNVKGTLILWARSGAAYGSFPAGDYGLISSADAAKSLLYFDEGGNICTFDGTNETLHNVNWPINTWRKYGLKWDASQSKVWVGADTGSGISWTEGTFDNVYTEGANLRLGYGLYAPLHFKDIQIYNRLLSDTIFNQATGKVQ